MTKTPDIFVAIALLLSACSGGSNGANGGAGGTPLAGGKGGAAGAAGAGGTVAGSRGGSPAIGGWPGAAGGCPGVGSGGWSSGEAGATFAAAEAAGGQAGGATGGAAGGGERTCDGKFAAPIAPLSVDVTLTCPSADFIPRAVAPASATKGFVSLFSSGAATHLVTITAPDEIEQEATPALEAQVIADPAGAPLLIGFRSPDYVPTAYRRDAIGWQPEALAELGSPNELWGAGFAADGLAYALFNTSVMTRSTGGVWSETALPSGFGILGEAFAIDAMQRPHVAFWGWGQIDGLVDWRLGATPVALKRGVDQPWGMAAAPVGTGRIAVAAGTSVGIHLYVPNAAGTVREQTLPGTAPVSVTGCSVLSSCTEVPPTPCAARGEGAGEWALAATSDGSLWIAYIYQHIEQAYVQSCVRSGNGYTCHSDLTEDRSTAELNLMRIPADGSPAKASDVRWHVSIPPYSFLELGARGTDLTMASMARPTTDSSVVRYLVIDTTKL